MWVKSGESDADKLRIPQSSKKSMLVFKKSPNYFYTSSSL
jgi:hypothetical protein